MGNKSSNPSVFIGAGLWCAIWFVDRGWFHKLLIGSVNESVEQEKILNDQGISTNLGDHNKKNNRIRFKKRKYPRGKRKGELVVWQSSFKLNLFYGIGLLPLGLMVIAICFTG